jgi:hypothetical protein
MRGIFILILLDSFSIVGFAQTPHWKDGEAPIPAHSNLAVRWEAPAISIPDSVWIYRLLPNQFSSDIISNLVTLCAFTGRDKMAETTNGVGFQAPDGSRKLSISFSSGSIKYETAEPHYGPTNLAEGVPAMSEMPKLAANFLIKVGINFSEITNPFDGEREIEGAVRFYFSEPGITYFVGKTNIHNTEYRTAKFWRCVDGIPVIGGDGGTITFGEHGKVRSFTISWRKLERYQDLPSVTSATAMKLIREGKAVQELVEGEIDWAKVKSVTIKKASPLYYDGHSEWLWPFLGLVAISEPGFGHTQFGIDCPMIDETKIIAH